MKAQCTVTFNKNHEAFEIPVNGQENLLQAAIDHDVPLEHSCGGFGTCGTCRVFVEKCVEKLPPREGLELEMAQDRGFAPNERLCCQTVPVDGMILRIPTGST